MDSRFHFSSAYFAKPAFSIIQPGISCNSGDQFGTMDLEMMRYE
jgi:hypothetical protein